MTACNTHMGFTCDFRTKGLNKNFKRRFNPYDPNDAEEMLNILESLEDSDDTSQSIDKANELEFVLLPPLDGQDSDRDDAPSDDERTVNFRDIGKGVLSQPMEVRAIQNQDKKHLEIGVTNSHQPSDELSSKRIKRRQRKWKTKKLERIESDQTDFKFIREEPIVVTKMRKSEEKPIDIFKLVFSHDIMEFICKETVKYAGQKGALEFQISVDDLYKYFGILLLSGYNPLPFRRMYWETKSDTYSFLVSKAMSRNRFEQIHRFLHFNDNTALDNRDKIYKIRPLTEHLNKSFVELIQPFGNCFSLDEAMEPYYGHHSMKQFIRGKPIRYGFKLWCLATFHGYLLKFDPYTGAGDKQAGKPLGTAVTEKLCLGFIPPGSTVFVDNYFNSLPLLESLRQHQINCIGTIRGDRCENAPLKDLRKEVRGSSHALQDNSSNITLVRWHDNSQVTIATNLESSVCLKNVTCKRWSRTERKHILVPQPKIVQIYNKGMGGVDLFDQMRGLYRTRIRSKKWYWPLFRFCLDGSIVNMWMIYRELNSMSLLEFRRAIVLALLISPDIERPRGPYPKGKVMKEVRTDNSGHLVDKISTQRRCGKCGKCTKFRCIKCNIGLHPDKCFVAFHTQI